MVTRLWLRRKRRIMRIFPEDVTLPIAKLSLRFQTCRGTAKIDNIDHDGLARSEEAPNP
jgi:hypothetical protein